MTVDPTFRPSPITRCDACGHYRDTPNHNLGCPPPKRSREALRLCVAQAVHGVGLRACHCLTCIRVYTLLCQHTTER